MFFMINIQMGFTFMNEKAMSLLLDLIIEMEVRFSVFWIDQTDIRAVKKFSNQYVATTQLTTGLFVSYTSQFLERAKIYSTAVVLREQTLITLEDFKQSLDNVSLAPVSR